MEAGALHPAIPNGYLAVWDGRTGASGLRSPAPASSSSFCFIFLSKNFQETPGRVWLRENRRGLGFCASLGERKRLSLSLDEGEASLMALGSQKVEIQGLRPGQRRRNDLD